MENKRKSESKYQQIQAQSLEYKSEKSAKEFTQQKKWSKFFA